MTLEEIRRNIDEIDTRIIGLLAERSRLVTQAGKFKKDEKGVRDSNRVEQVILKVRTKAAAVGLDPALAEKAYRTIIGCFIEQELRDFEDASENGRMKT